MFINFTFINTLAERLEYHLQINLFLFSEGLPQVEGLPNPLKISTFTWFSVNDSNHWAWNAKLIKRKKHTA